LDFGLRASLDLRRPDFASSVGNVFVFLLTKMGLLGVVCSKVFFSLLPRNPSVLLLRSLPDPKEKVRDFEGFLVFFTFCWPCSSPQAPVVAWPFLDLALLRLLISVTTPPLIELLLHCWTGSTKLLHLDCK
jgi:hypothetical protein